MLLRKITLTLLNISGLFIAIAWPLIIAYKKIFILVPNKQTVNLVLALVLGVFSLIYFKWIKRNIDRKINARVTVEEFGTQGYSSPIWIRLLRILELAIPIFSITMIFYCATLVPTEAIWGSWKWLIGFQVISQGMFMIHDILKHHWMIYNEALKQMKVERTKERIAQRITLK